MGILQEFTKLNQPAYIDLFEIDLAPTGVTTSYAFVPDKNTDGTSISYKGKVYNPLPIEITGFELTSKAPFPKPIMRVSNVQATISSLMLLFSDLVGAKVTRRRTLVKYLDGYSEAGGEEISPEIYFVERPVEETEIAVTFELVNGLEWEGVTLPRRFITRRCGWRYRGADCSYTGNALYTENDQYTTDPNQDRCSKTVHGCKLRFGTYAELPYGGFPLVEIG